jgi:hypothetical protein
MPNQDPVDGAGSETELVRDATGTEPSLAKLKNTAFDARTDLRRRLYRPPTGGAQPGEVGGLISLPPPAQDLARDLKVGT